jgi:hypothetical protein
VHDRASASTIKATTEVVAADADDGDFEISDPSRVHSSVPPFCQTQ